MRGKILTLFLVSHLLLAGKILAQNGVTIFGPTSTQPNDISYYWAQFDNPPNWNSTITWGVYGGTIISKNENPTNGTIFCYIQWDQGISQSWVDIYEDVGGAFGVLNVTVGQPLHPGAIYTNNLTYNFLSPTPIITQDPASEGSCSGAYQYTWYMSVNGANGINIGNSASFPTNPPIQLTANTTIWRNVQCGNESANTNILEFKYQPATWENRNYIRTNEVWYAGKTDFIQADNIPIGQKQQSVVFYDGLGRPQQTIVVGASAETGNAATSKKDLVTHIEYDALGREVKKHLAYQASTADGKFKANALTAQQTYMTAKYPGEANFFAETEMEANPLNRGKKSKAPGLNWGAANKGLSTTRELNTVPDEVRIWKIDAFAVGAIPVSQANDFYPANTLIKTTITDERDKKIIEYRDKDDRVILKKQQLLEGVNLTQGHGGWLCTYYVYDDFGRMRFVITPKAVDQIRGSWVISQTIADGLCYSYTFDRKHRLVEKKLPDVSPAYMVYDNRDRVVFTQDGIQRAGKTNTQLYPEWTFFLYDVQNRGVATGNMRQSPGTPYTRASLQAAIDNPVNILGEKTFSISTDVAENITAFNPVPLFSANGATITHFDVKINTVTYYDQATAGQYVPQIGLYPSNFDNIDDQPLSNRTRGMQTGTKARALDGSPNKFLSANTVYDEKGRVVQSKTTNYLNHALTTSNQYDFSGKLRCNVYTDVKVTTVGVVPAQYTTTEAFIVNTKFEQDHVGRIKQIKKTVTRNFHTTQAVDPPNPLVTTTGEKVVVENTYDELGQLTSKKLAPGYSGPNGAYLENLLYEYNIRGWMTGINKSYISNSSKNGAFFGMELGYDKAGNAAFVTPILNGNVAGMAWKTRGDNAPRKFDYTYDNANRLSTATFRQRNDFGTPNNWSNTTFNFSVPVINYDYNGNITRMEQMGVNFSGIVPMDRMTYGYDATSNKVNWVAEDVNTDYKLNDFTDKNAGANNVDYTYDENANLKEDKNKGITSIKYNYLSLPEQVDFDGNRGNIKYIYDAFGNKLQKVVTDNTPGTPVISTTTYSGPVTHTGSGPFISFEDGRVRYAKTVTPNAPLAFTFDYFIKDNLGNIRMVLTEDAQTDNYPAATMETATAVQEDKYYKIPNRTDLPVEIQGVSGVAARYGQKMAKLTTLAGGQKIGPSILLKVMSGDLVHSSTDYYYKDNGTQVNGTTLLNDLTTNLVTHLLAGQAGHTAKAQSGVINGNVGADATVGTLISGQNSSYVATRPKAFLNYIVFDEQFKAYAKGHIQVQANGALQVPLTRNDIAIDKNGWIYVFVNNESQQNVYFDNFKVTHVRGNIMEETHYYPFGLTMKAISPRALSIDPVNKLKYNGKEIQQEEFSDGSGLEGYDFGARIFDPQTGRWHTIDPMAEDFPNVSPYSYAVNNPTLYIDKDGKFVHLILQYGINVGINVAMQMLTAYMFDSDVNSWSDAWDKVSMWDAIWDGATDMISSKKLKMAAEAVRGIFTYIDQVGFRNVTIDGLLSAGLLGILEPIVGDAMVRHGSRAVQLGLKKLGISGRSLANVMHTAFLPSPDKKIKKFPTGSKILQLAKQYQARFSGDADLSFELKSVSFDAADVNRGKLIDAKFGHGTSLFEPDGEDFNILVKGRADKLLEQAQRQRNAIDGTDWQIEWHISTKLGADGIRDLFAKNGVTWITVVHTPF